MKFMGVVFAPDVDKTTHWVYLGGVQTHSAIEQHKAPRQRVPIPRKNVLYILYIVITAEA